MEAEKGEVNSCFIDINDCRNYEMRTAEKKEFDENIVLFTEHDHEEGVLRITIPLRVLPTFTKEQREELIMENLADLIRKELQL